MSKHDFLSALLRNSVPTLAVLIACYVPAVPASAASQASTQLPALSSAQLSAQLSDPLPLNPRLKMGKLDNGLSYYIQKNPRPAQRVELRLVVNAGSILEDDDQRGMAHFVEHMGFNGSSHFKKHELVAYLESIGVRFGADLNASTGFDSTIYLLPIPTDKPGNLEQGMQVLEDWAHGMTLGSEQIEDERNIILEEKRLRSGFGMRRLEAVLPKLANGTHYKERLAIGTEDSIAHGKADALRRFYADWYRPDLMAVIVVGDVDAAEAERLLRRHFAHIKMPAKPRVRPQYPVPPLAGSDSLVFTDKEAPNNSVQLVYSLYQHKPAATVGDYRTALVAQLFSSMMGMRLTRLTLLPDPPLAQGSAGEAGVPYGVNQRMYAATATIGKAGIGPAIDALVRENHRVREFGFTASELFVAKGSVLSGYEHRYQSRDTRESSAVLTDYIRHFLAQEPMPGIENEYAYAQAFLPGITLDELHAYAKATIPADAPKLVLLTGNGSGSGADVVPASAGAAVLARAQAAQNLPVSRLIDKELPTHLMDDKPAPGRIVEQSEDKALGVTRLLLSNGVKVVLKPTDFSKDVVQMQAARPGGQMLYPDADKTALRFAGAVQEAMGVAAYTPSDLRIILTGKNISVGAGMSGYSDQLHGSSGSKDIESMLQLNYLAMTQPRRDARLFRAYVNRNVEQVRGSMAVPEARFADARLQTLYGGHPRVDLQARPEDFEALNLERMSSLFYARMGSARGMTFFFVGDFEVEAIKPLLATYVATLPTGEVPLQYRDPGIRQVPGVVKREVKAGVEQKSLVTIDFSGDVAFSKAEALAFRAMVNVLNIRITAELRERLQLIYSGGASGRYEAIPRGAYALSLRLPTAPQNVDKVEAALWREIDSLQGRGPAAEDLDKVKQAMLQGYRKALRENGYWLQFMRTAEAEGGELADILTQEQRINALSAAAVQAAARRFLDKQQYVEMVLRPEA